MLLEATTSMAVILPMGLHVAYEQFLLVLGVQITCQLCLPCCIPHLEVVSIIQATQCEDATRMQSQSALACVHVPAASSR